MIFRHNDIEKLILKVSKIKSDTSICSGFFDPAHSGHIRYIMGSAHYGKLIVIVNGTSSCIWKKGYELIPISQRLEIVHSIKGVTHVLEWDEDNMSKIIKFLSPTYFCNGGDRSDAQNLNHEEVQACEIMGTKMVLGVGGYEKTESSSNLLSNYIQWWQENKRS